MAEQASKAKRQVVFSIREFKDKSIWTRIGTAFTNRDGSLNVILDSLPIDGRLHIREESRRGESGSEVNQSQVAA